MTDASDGVEEYQGSIMQIDPLIMNIQTPAKNDNVNKRSIEEVVDMEVDEQSSSNRIKTNTRDKDIIILEEEESINQGKKGGYAIVENVEEQEHNVSTSEETISQSRNKAQKSQATLEIQQYPFLEAQSPQYKSKKDLIFQYTWKMNQAFEENQKFLTETRKVSQEKMSLITVREPSNSTLNIVVAEENKVSEIKIKMDQINVPDQIHFHMQTSEVLYLGLSHSTLNNIKLETRVVRLKE